MLWSFFTFFCLFSLCISLTVVISVCITYPPSTVCIDGYHHDHDCHIYHKRINDCSESFIYMLKLIFDMSLQDSYTYVLHIYVMCVCVCVCVYLWVWVCVKYTYILDERMWSERLNNLLKITLSKSYCNVTHNSLINRPARTLLLKSQLRYINLEILFKSRFCFGKFCKVACDSAFLTSSSSKPLLLVHRPHLSCKLQMRYFSGPVVNISSSKDWSVGSIPGVGAEIPHALWPKTQT